MTTKAEGIAIAHWMLEQYQEHSRLSQRVAARGIRQHFGEQHVYKNKQHNWAINKEILEEFRRLTPDDVVWSRSTQVWRQRRPKDSSNSRMVR
ncbi:MAG: hypothetical protein LAP21_27005 [Acidobacteriia bacterium]|nr:hypothetical protein [Terriglobia bacterium]